MLYTIKINNVDFSNEVSSLGVVETLDKTYDYASIVIPYIKLQQIFKRKQDFDITLNDGVITVAGNFIIGNTYKITSIGTTDFTVIGASSNTVGEIFEATGVGTGTGTAENHREYNLIVDSIVEKESPENYWHYEIIGVERTKKLEGFPCSNRTFTQPISGIRYYLADIVNDYRLTIPFERTVFLNNNRLFTVDPTLEARWGAIRAPQIFSDNKQLKENLNDIANYDRGIIRLDKNDVLKVDYFNSLANLVNSKLNASVSNTFQDLSEYATSIDVIGSNMVHGDSLIPGSIVEPSLDDFMKTRSIDSIYTSDNAIVLVRFRIERTIIVTMLVEIFEDATRYVEIDITANVVENEIYKTLKDDTSDKDTLYSGVFKANALLYTRGDKVISKLYENFGLFNNIPAIQNVIKSGLYNTPGESWTGDVAGVDAVFVTQDYDELEFRVRYVPNYTGRFQVDKVDLSDVDTATTIIQNQSETILDTSRVLDKSFDDLQIRGNKITETLEAQIFSLNDIKNIGDYTSQGLIITKKELIAHPESIDVKYQFSKDYQQVSDFLGLTTPIKLFDIPNKGQTLTRNILYKEYIEISKDTSPPTNTLPLITTIGIETFMNTITQTPTATYNKPILAMAFFSEDTILYKDDDETDVPLSSLDRIIIPVISTAGGNSLHFYAEFDSPNVVGDQIIRQDGIFQPFARPTLRSVQYTDNQGLLNEFKFKLVNSYTGDPELYPVVPNVNITDVLIGENNFTLKKDASNNLSITYQLMLEASQKDKDDIIVGQRLLKRNNLIEDKGDVFPDTLSIYSSDERYNRNDNRYVKGIKETLVSYTTVRNNLDIEIELSQSLNTAKSWAIGNEEGDLYLAINQLNQAGVLTPTTKIIMGFRNKRNDVNE